MSVTKVLSEMVSFVPVSGITSTNVQAAIPESAANLASSIAAPTGSSLVGYLPAGTGAVATTVQTKLRESVSIVDFGGVAGASDNTVAMNAAASYLNGIGGGVILIPYVGEWRMNWVCLYNNITVQGVGGSGEYNTNCIRPYVITSAAITFGDGTSIVRYCGLNNLHISGIPVAGSSAPGITQSALNADWGLRLRGGVVNFTANQVVVYNGIRSVSLEPSTTMPVSGVRFNNGTIRNDLTDSALARGIYIEYVNSNGYATDNQFQALKLNGPTLGYAAIAINCLLEVNDSYWDIKPEHGILLSGSSTLVCYNLQLDPGTSGVVVIGWQDATTNPARYIRGILRHGGQLWRNSTITGALLNESDSFGYQFLGQNTFLSNTTYITKDTDTYNTDVSLYRATPAGGESLVLGGANFTSSTDNTKSLGVASNRWSVVYAGTGTINTSDGNEKQQVRQLSDAEKAVAVQLKLAIRAFKFNDAVNNKKENARVHFGVIAQDVKAAFEAENLNAEQYAMFCSDVWIDENGAEHVRLGVRYEELLAFVISAI